MLFWYLAKKIAGAAKRCWLVAGLLQQPGSISFAKTVLHLLLGCFLSGSNMKIRLMEMTGLRISG